ncbi:MAG: FtsX-like permease family protein, partial [Candidatus Thorarchaeota archaeon]
SFAEIEMEYRATLGGALTSRPIILIGLSDKDLEFLGGFLGNVVWELNGNNTLMFFMSQGVSSTIYVPTNLLFNFTYSEGSTMTNISLADVPFDASEISETNPIRRRFQRQFGENLVDRENIIMITSLSGMAEIFTNFGVEPYLHPTSYIINIDLDYTKFGILSSQRDKKKTNDIQVAINRVRFPETSFVSSYVYNRIYYNLEGFFADYNIIQAVILALTIPPISIGFFMINFSFNLVRKENIHQINLLKSRGATNRQVFNSLFLEMILSSTISIVLGTAIGIPLLFLIGRTSGFMEFKSEIPIAQYSVALAGGLTAIIIISGITLSLVINLPRIISLSRTEARNIAGELKRKEKPFWQKFNLDLFLGIFAVICLVGFLSIGSIEEENIKTIATTFFGSATPILIVSSLSLVISRYYTRFIQKVGDKIWKRKAGTFALSFKNLSHQNKQTSRAVILIVISLTFGILSAVVPSTIDFNAYQRWAYVEGADIIIDNPFTNQEYRQNIADIPNVAGVTLVITNYDYYSMDLGWGLYGTYILGIDPDTFLDGAYIKPLGYGLSKNINTLVKDLATPGTVMIQRNNLYNAQLRIGDTFTTSNTYEIIGSFKFFPNLITSRYYELPLSEKYIIASIDTIQQLLGDFGYVALDYKMYIKQAVPGTSQQIMDDIKEIHSSAMVESTELDVADNFDMPARISIYAMLNSSFITTIISTIAGLAIYSLLILFDRQKELAIIRAIGAERKEIFKSFIWETFLIMIIGIIIGLPLGIGVSLIISNVINSYYDIPPVILDVPWLALAIILVIIVIVSIGLSCIPGYYASKKEINELSRVN